MGEYTQTRMPIAVLSNPSLVSMQGIGESSHGARTRAAGRVRRLCMNGPTAFLVKVTSHLWLAQTRSRATRWPLHVGLGPHQLLLLDIEDPVAEAGPKRQGPGSSPSPPSPDGWTCKLKGFCGRGGSKGTLHGRGRPNPTHVWCLHRAR